MAKVNLTGLNEQQKEAVTSINGVNQVIAGAGSGKTRVLTYRIAYMIEQGINPESILVATFTKKAAAEMIERLESIITKKAIKDLTIGTFHSIGYHILKNEYIIMNHPLKNFQLLQGKPLQWLIKECLNELNIQTSDSYNESLFAAEINRLKMANFTPESFIASALTGEISKHDKNVMAVYEKYEFKKNTKNLIDFNDMLFKVYYLLMEYPKILKKYQDKFQYILCDETQDCNESQYDLINMLSKPQNNIFIVGDHNQSIYKFRGAQPQHFVDFKDSHNNVKIINLNQNYRSLPYILETANKIISSNNSNILLKLQAFRKTENEKIEKPYFSYAEDEDEEADIVTDYINALNEQNKSLGDMAIIYRTNAQSRALEDKLIGKGIPYIIFNGISFYERAEVKDLIAYLKLSMNTDDNESFKRIINKPNRYLGKKFLSELEKIAQQHKISLYKALDFIKNSYRIQQNVDSFTRIIETIMFNRFSEKNVGDLIYEIRHSTKYDEFLIKENGNEEDNVKIENVNSLITAASRYASPQKFIDYVEMIANAKIDENVPVVKLMTIHKSKGLEYDMVFMIGMSEGLLPHKYALEEETTGNIESIEEERRLAYVGITRAKDFLMVTSPESYQHKPQTPSRFLKEGEFIEKEEIVRCTK